MSTFFFVTKPEYTPERVERGIDVPWWSCSSTTQVGNRALVYVTGIGVQYEWRVTSSAEPHEKWKYVCDVEHVRTFEPPIGLQEILKHVTREEWAPPHMNFRGYRSIQVTDEVADRIRQLRPEVSQPAQ
jgi:hypothetical protein